MGRVNHHGEGKEQALSEVAVKLVCRNDDLVTAEAVLNSP